MLLIILFSSFSFLLLYVIFYSLNFTYFTGFAVHKDPLGTPQTSITITYRIQVVANLINNILRNSSIESIIGGQYIIDVLVFLPKSLLSKHDF